MRQVMSSAGTGSPQNGKMVLKCRPAELSGVVMLSTTLLQETFWSDAVTIRLMVSSWLVTRVRQHVLNIIWFASALTFGV